MVNGDTQEYWRWEDGEDDDRKPEASKDGEKEAKKSDDDHKAIKSAESHSQNKDDQNDEGWTSGGLDSAHSVRLTAAGNKKNKK